MTLKQIMEMSEGETFYYKHQNAQVIWKEFVEFQITKPDPTTKPPTPATFWRAFSMHFSLENSLEGVTLTSSYPFPNILECEEFSK